MAVSRQDNIQDEYTKHYSLKSVADYQQFYGVHDENLESLEKAFDVAISANANELRITGKKQDVLRSVKLLNGLDELAKDGFEITREEFRTAIRNIEDDGAEQNLRELLLDGSVVTTKKRKVFPKTARQKEYIDAIRKKGLVFCIGPAGTGKTYLAVAMAVTYLLAKKVSRIILTRPAVEAGESLGFLPGDMYQKVNPYVRPLYDALYDLLDLERANRMVERGVIEVAPIAYMRGRTLNDSFIILDEAQNTTPEQMKMFLTRLGYNAKAVVTGDITQIDLPVKKKSGLVQVQSILKGVPDIEFVYLKKTDVVRCSLVQDIVNAYEMAEKGKEYS